MAKQATDVDAIAAFIAKRGVTKLAQGESTLGHMTGRDWAKAARDTVTVQARRQARDEQAMIDARYYVTDSAGVEHCRNGLGEWLY